MTIVQWARRLRPRFQVGLLGWIRGERVRQNLEILARVSEKLEQVATKQPVFQLWWVVGAVLEALRDGGLPEGATIKRLMGLADREIKRLFNLGENRYADSAPLDLLNNLLYYVARSAYLGPARGGGACVVQAHGPAARRSVGRAGAGEPLSAERQAHAHRRAPRSGRP